MGKTPEERKERAREFQRNNEGKSPRKRGSRDVLDKKEGPPNGKPRSKETKHKRPRTI